jgi:hypothetical protein
MIKQVEVPITEKPSRNALLIALYILQMIPEEQKDFYNAVDHLVKTDYFYKDQHALGLHYNWKKLEVIMHTYIPTADEEWKEKIVDVYIGKTIPQTESNKKII